MQNSQFKRKDNLKFCNCTYDCSKKGLCCECVKFHRQRGELPGCYFSKEKEGTYGRSIENYLKK